MFNLNEKYFPISERCGRNHQNKFLFTSPKETFSPWELSDRVDSFSTYHDKEIRKRRGVLGFATDARDSFFVYLFG